jgi:hypothetical protein
MILWSESVDAAATKIKISFPKSKRRVFLGCFKCSDKMNALETDKSMHVCARYSQDHARVQNLRKPEHETGRK